MSEVHPIISDLVPAMANSIVQRFKSYVEAEDVRQECLMWAMSRTDYINEQSKQIGALASAWILRSIVSSLLHVSHL